MREISSQNDQQALETSPAEAAQEGKTTRLLGSADTSFIPVTLNSLNELLLFVSHWVRPQGHPVTKMDMSPAFKKLRSERGRQLSKQLEQV